MRDKVKKLMSLIMVPFDANIATHLAQFEQGFKQVQGDEIPAEGRRALEAIGEAMRARKGLLEESVIDVYLKHLSEADLDALIPFYESDAYRKLTGASMPIMSEIADVESKWVQETMQSIEDKLEEVLGVPPAPPPAEAPEPTAS